MAGRLQTAKLCKTFASSHETIALFVRFRFDSFVLIRNAAISKIGMSGTKPDHHLATRSPAACAYFFITLPLLGPGKSSPGMASGPVSDPWAGNLHL